MKPRPFDYYAPDNVRAAVDALTRYDGEAKVIAGGQSLMPLLNLRLAEPTAVVDLNGLAELAYHRVEPEVLAVGALCRHREVELSPKVTDRVAAIGDAVPLVGHVAIRNRGTVVGSVTHAEPSAEWPALALLLDARITAQGASGTRTLDANDFFLGHFTTALEQDEIVTEICFQLPRRGTGSAFVELARRHGDFAIAGVGAVVDLETDETIRDARLVLTGVAPTPIRASVAEDALLGQPAIDTTYAKASTAAAQAMRPSSDIHASASFRRHLAEVLVRRALQTAAQRAKGAQE